MEDSKTHARDTIRLNVLMKYKPYPKTLKIHKQVLIAVTDVDTVLWQDVNTRTGTRLDCPRPPDNKWANDVEVDYLDPQQMSPRFLPRRNRTDSTPGTVIRAVSYCTISFDTACMCAFLF
jgi:hypothetical protein